MRLPCFEFGTYTRLSRRWKKNDREWARGEKKLRGTYTRGDVCVTPVPCETHPAEKYKNINRLSGIYIYIYIFRRTPVSPPLETLSRWITYVTEGNFLAMGSPRREFSDPPRSAHCIMHVASVGLWTADTFRCITPVVSSLSNDFISREIGREDRKDRRARGYHVWESCALSLWSQAKIFHSDRY